MFAVGDTVGDYQIVAKLKSGGMATLFLGRRVGAEGFSRHVAIKVVHEHLANDPTFVQMFVDEALLSAKIQHPNVVHVEELRELNGRHFLAMEYVHGCPLSTLMTALRERGRTLGPELATYIAVEVAEGLHAAHETKGSDGQLLGVVHRDVSPQNVLLAYRGHVKLIDFGVAKARGRAQQTTGGSLKGKIGYMSPEQAFGRPVDRRTDVYALGVVLWEMLTGRRAFAADNDFALLELVRNPNLPPPSTLNPAVPPALDAVVARATAREPDQRFETAQQMRKALAQAVPSALALDASDLERLLAATVGEEIERERRVLPESVSGIVSAALLPAPADAEEIVATLTVSAANLLATGADPTSRSSGVREKAPEPFASPSGTLVLPTNAPEAASPAPARASRAPWIALGASTALLVIGGAAVLAWKLVSEPPPMEAIELPRTAEPSVSPQAEPPAPPTQAVPVLPSDEPTAAVAEPPGAPVAEGSAAPSDERAAAVAEPHEPVAPPSAGAAPSEPAADPVRERRAATRPARPRPVRRSSRREPPGGVPLADEF
ncbi:MAG TPA: protein kinase [Sandaracinaceae bacterium]